MDFMQFHATLAKRIFTRTTCTVLARNPLTMLVEGSAGASQTTCTGCLKNEQTHPPVPKQRLEGDSQGATAKTAALRVLSG